jgi:hypothetical protein
MGDAVAGLFLALCAAGATGVVTALALTKICPVCEHIFTKSVELCPYCMHNFE